MTTSDILFLGVAVPIVGAMAISYAGRRTTRTLRGYFWGDRSLSASDTADLYISTSLALGNAIVFFSWAGYAIGLSALWLQVAWCASFWIAKRFAARIAARSTEGTLHGSLSRSYGATAAKLAAFASILGFTLNLGWEIVAGVKVFSILSPAGPFTFLLTVSLATTAAAYTMLGGLRGNLLANKVQNAMSYVALVVLCAFLATRKTASGTLAVWSLDAPSLTPSFGPLVAVLGVGGLVTNIVISVVWQFVDMSSWQNLAATKPEESTPERALTRSMIWIFFFPGFFSVLAGMLAKHMTGLKPDTIMPTFIQLLSGNSLVLFIVVAGFVAAMLSTVDGFLLASSQALTWDILNRSEAESVLRIGTEGEQQVQRRLLSNARIAALAFAVAGALTVYWLNSFGLDLFNIVYVTYSAQIALLPAVLAMLLEYETSPSRGVASIAIGIGCGLAAALVGFRSGQAELLTWAPVIGMAAAALPLVNGKRLIWALVITVKSAIVRLVRER